MLTNENNPADILIQQKQEVPSTQINKNAPSVVRKLGILGQALAQVRESGFGQLEYPHKEICEDAHAS